jgi:hypothetical protein
MQSSGTNRHFLLTNSVANRLLVPVLKSRVGARLGRRLAVVEYVGRRSRKPYRLVAQYVTHGRTVRIEVGMADRKNWWRNFTSPHPLRLLLAGEQHDATAYVVRQGTRTSVIAELQG